MAIATMVGPRVPSRDVGRHVQAELTNLLYQNTRGMHLAGLAVSLLLVIVFRQTALSRHAMEAWFGCMAAIEFGRGILGRRFRHRSIPLNDVRVWRRRFLIGSCVSALGWGTAGVLLQPPRQATINRKEESLTHCFMGVLLVRPIPPDE